MKIFKISVVIPVYDDWESSVQLINEIILFFNKEYRYSIEKIIVVNDASQIPSPVELIDNEFIKIINLSTNLGHQRSIAIGLCYVYNNLVDSKYIIVMDSDGEDKPSDISSLLNKAYDSKDDIVFAKRTKRSESLSFKLNYFIYKKVFKILTNTEISFGNFCVIPFSKIQNIISNPDLWNHFSASIIKSRLKFTTLSTERGYRYFGKSKMNFTNLVTHGLSSISIFIDIIIVRLLVLNVIAVLISLSTLLSLFLIKVFSSYQIPGWTPVYTLAIFNILIFSLIFTLLLVLIQLNIRSVVKKPPKSYYNDFILDE